MTENLDSIEFEVTVNFSAIELLRKALYGYSNIDLNEILIDQFNQGDPCIDKLHDDIENAAKENGLDADKIISKFESLSSKEILDYVFYNVDNIEFVGAEEYDTLGYTVYCDFDMDKFAKDTEEK